MNKQNKLLKIIRKLHLYLGFTSGLIVFLVAFTGALFVFFEEILDIYYHEDRYIEVPQNATEVLPSQVFEAALAKLPEFKHPEDAHFHGIRFADPEKAHVVFVEEMEDKKMVEMYAVFVNPYTGEATGYFKPLKTVFPIILEIHRSLLFSSFGQRDLGKHIVAIATIFFIFNVIFGLYLWWPKTWKNIRPRLTIKFKKSKRLNYDIHTVLGVYLSWILLIIAFTGIMFSYKWVSDGVYWLFAGNTPKTEEPKFETMIKENKNMDKANATLDKLYPEIVKAYPDASKIVFNKPHSLKEPVNFLVMESGAFYDSKGLYYDAITEKEVFQDKFSDKNLGEQVTRLALDLHTGFILGLPTKILACLASLFVASLPITGFFIWYPKWKMKRRVKKRKKDRESSLQVTVT